MSRNEIVQHVFSHSFYNISANSLRFIISAAMVIYLARELGPSQYGIVSLGLSIAVIVGVFCDFGITTSTARFLAEKGESAYNTYYNNGFFLNIVFAAIFTSFFLLLSNPIAKLTNISSPIYLHSIVVLIFFNATFYYSIRSLQGIRRTDKIAFLIFFQTIITNLLIFVTVAIGFKAKETLWAYSLAAMISWGFSIILIKKYLPIFKLNLNIPITKDILLYALPLLLTSSLYFLILQGPLVILAARTSSTEVAYLNIPLKLAEVLSLPAYSISLVCCPFFATQNQIDESRKWLYVKISKYILFFYIPISLFLLLLSKDVIIIVFGTAYERASSVLVVFSLYIPFFALANFSGTVLDFLGIARQKSLVFALFTGIAIALSIVLIPVLRETGASLAIVIPYTLFSIYTIIVSSKKCRVNVTNYFSHLVKLLLISGLSLIPAKLALNCSSGFLKLVLAFLSFAVILCTVAIASKLIHLQEIKGFLSVLKNKGSYDQNESLEL